MKYLIMLIIIIFFWISSSNKITQTQNVSQNRIEIQSTPIIENNNQYEITTKSGKIMINWFITDKKIRLIPNFTDKLTSSIIIDKYKCQKITSAGFYSPDHKPIGLFISNNIRLNDFNKNNTLNGIFSIDNDGKYNITSLPIDSAVDAFQSGPIIFKDNHRISLTLSSDEKNRRIVLALAENNLLYLIALYNPENTFDGPFLSEIPEIIDNFNNNFNFNFSDALNLDGGSASHYFDGKVNLSELSLIGSALCIN